MINCVTSENITIHCDLLYYSLYKIMTIISGTRVPLLLALSNTLDIYDIPSIDCIY